MNPTIFKIKKFNVLKFAVNMATIYTIISLIVIIPFSLFSLAFGNQIAILSILMIILLPLLYGLIGFVSGLIFSYIYNVVSKYIGGIEVEVETIEKFSE